MQTNKQAELYYWLGDNTNFSGTDQWVKAETPDGKNALISFDFEHKINMPAKAKVVLSNTIPNFLASDADSFTGHLSTLASGSDSATQSPLFTDFMRVILVDAHSKLVLISGRIYDVQQEYNGFQGYSTTLEIKDELEMLRGLYVDEISDVSVTSSTERSDVIKDSLINADAWAKPSAVDIAIDISDTGTNPEDRLQTSAGTYPATDTIKFSKSGGNVLQEINNISQEDPISTEDSDKIAATYGYDYYLDANFASVDNSGADTRTPPSPHFNYFKRGDRPNNGNSPQTYGLSVEFPTGTGFSKTGQKLPMLTNFDFERPKYEVFTDATVTGVRADKGRVSKNFELLNVVSITQNSSANFKWAGTEFDKNTDTTLVDGTGAAEFLDLYTADGSSKTQDDICRVQYQSTESGTGYILISDIDASKFPAGAGQVRLVGATTGTHCLFTPNTGRFRNKFPGVKRTFKTQWGGEGTNDALRRKMATQLSRAGVTGNEIVRGSFNIAQFPYYHVDNTMSGSDSATTVTWTNFADSAKDVRKYGLKPSMPIGILDSNGGHFSHYNYTTAVSSTTATVAAAPQNASGGTANFSASSQTIRFYVPIRAGDFIYVKNHIENIAGNFLVTKVSFNESPGIQNTRLEVVGKDTAIAGKVAKANAPNVSGDGKGADGDIVPKGSLSFSFPTGVSNTRVTFTATDADTVTWTAGPILLGNGEQYQIDAGNTGNMTAYASTGTDAQKAATTYILYWAEDDSDAIRIVTQAAWDPTSDTIEIGWARADSDANGKSEFMINGTNPDGQSFGLTTEIHTPGNSVSITPTGIDIREGTGSDAFLNFYKGSTKLTTMFTTTAAANGDSVNADNRDGDSIPAVFSTGSSGANTNFQMFFPEDNSVMQIGSGGKFHFRPHLAGASLGSSTKEWTYIYGGDYIVPEGSGTRISGSLLTSGSIQSESNIFAGVAGGSHNGYYSFADDTTTYIDNPADDQLRIVTDGTQNTLFEGGNVFTGAGGDFGGVYSFTFDPDTFIRNPSANRIDIMTGNTTNAVFEANNIYVGPGGGFSGVYTFTNDTNTSISNPSADRLDLNTGGALAAAFTGGDMYLGPASTGNFYTFNGDTDTAIINPSSDLLRILVGNSTLAEFREAGGAFFTGINQAFNASYGLIVAGTAAKTSAGTVWISTSDDRLKQDVLSITNATDALKTLNPVEYNWKDEWKDAVSSIPNHKVHGFLASEYEDTFSDFVDTTDMKLIKKTDNSYRQSNEVEEDETIIYDNIKFINTDSLVPYLVAAIKELETRISSLEGE